MLKQNWAGRKSIQRPGKSKIFTRLHPIQLGPKVKHGSDKSKVTKNVIERVNHKFVLVVIKHAFEQILNSQAFILYFRMRIFFTVTGFGGRIHFLCQWAIVAVEGWVLFSGRLRLSLGASVLERRLLREVLKPIQSDGEGEIGWFLEKPEHNVSEVFGPGVFEVFGPELDVTLLYFSVEYNLFP